MNFYSWEDINTGLCKQVLMKMTRLKKLCYRKADMDVKHISQTMFSSKLKYSPFHKQLKGKISCLQKCSLCSSGQWSPCVSSGVQHQESPGQSKTVSLTVNFFKCSTLHTKMHIYSYKVLWVLKIAYAHITYISTKIMNISIRTETSVIFTLSGFN